MATFYKALVTFSNAIKEPVDPGGLLMLELVGGHDGPPPMRHNGGPSVSVNLGFVKKVRRAPTFSRTKQWRAAVGFLTLHPLTQSRRRI